MPSNATPVTQLAGGALLLQREGASARLVINRPDRRNAMTWEVIAGLREGLGLVRADPDIRSVVFAGAGDRAFCAGADLGGMADDASAAATHRARGELAALFTDMWGLGKPTVARVQGYCLAGGFGLAMACDIVVASEDAVFGVPEINVGLWAHMITVPLVRSMPPKVALEMMMTGRRVDASEAASIGFVNRVVAPDELDVVVADYQERFASVSPSVMQLGRDGFYSVLDLPAAQALAQLHPLLSLNTTFDDTREGITAFAEKRAPVWRGR